LGTVDYKLNQDEVVLRIADVEKSKCVLQVGTCTEEYIVEIAKRIGPDVSAIDINMGCPKPFSLTGGMGAALLSKPDLVKTMISSLVSVSPVPVSCKIRVFQTVSQLRILIKHVFQIPETLEFAQMLEKTGISAIGIHGRRKDERPNDTNRFEEIREVARELSIPVIAKFAKPFIPQ
jgi:tRNA-dihydrouridine synthase 2